MNALDRYLRRTKQSCAMFAARIGVKDSSVWRWAKDKRAPTLTMAIRIEKASEGEVPIASWDESISRSKAPAGKKMA